MKTTHLVTAALALAPILAFATPALALNVTLQNPSFDTPTPGTILGDPVNTPAVCSGATGWSSASAGWTTWANTTTSQVVSWIATAPGGYVSNLVSAGGGGDGLVQVLASQGTTTNVNRVGAWVYVIAGQASVQIGDGGCAGGSFGSSTTRGTWEYISACGRPDMLNNEITIYSGGPSIFYVSDAYISFDASCGSCVHPANVTGKALQATCGSCENKICAKDPYCCTTLWDATCVSEAAASCSVCEP